MAEKFDSVIGKKENPENNLNNILSYRTIRNSFAQQNEISTGELSTVNAYNFRHVYDRNDKYDQPGAFIFKLVFYFDDASGSEGDSFEGGLLGGVTAKSEEEAKNTMNAETSYGNNSALWFLLANGEYERAQYLNTFLELLSDINVKSPWYFQTLTGLSEGLQNFKDGKWKYDESSSPLPPYKLEIGLLDDSIDTRISTMLDAYKAACFSKIQKKEIIPANLRKFNMGVYIGNVPIRSINRGKKMGASSSTEEPLSEDTTSYKYFELRGCEIDIAESYSTENISNENPFNIKHKLVIRYSNIYEEAYNALMGRFVSDYILSDVFHRKAPTEKDAELRHKQFKQELMTYNIENSTSKSTGKKKGFFTNAAEQIVAFGTDKVKSAVTRLYLGNIYTVSGKRLIEQGGSLLNGNVLGAVRDVNDYRRNLSNTKLSGNIYSGDAKGTVDILSANPSIHTDGTKSKKKYLGNIYKDKRTQAQDATLRNNV